MLPKFPDFMPVTLELQTVINKKISLFEPYSDYNFVSLFSWDVHSNIQVSELGDNLVVQFSDYMSNEPFLSFLGDNAVDKTILELLYYCNELKLKPELSLIPEEVVKKIQNPKTFYIKEDRDSFDYIGDALALTELKGKSFAGKRHSLNKFTKAHNDIMRDASLKVNKHTKNEILSTFNGWRQASQQTSHETVNELTATKRLLDNANHFQLEILGIYIHDKMVAFSIYEILNKNFAIGHFEKALRSYDGLFDFLKYKTARNLVEKNVRYINFEQDLGIEGLRKAKLLQHPVRFLKKYTIRLKQ